MAAADGLGHTKHHSGLPLQPGRMASAQISPHVMAVPEIACDIQGGLMKPFANELL